MLKSPKVKIVWESISGTKHSKMVDEKDAQREMDRLRGLADVKSNSVRISM